jgi:serine/threonine protein phosphatase 1
MVAMEELFVIGDIHGQFNMLKSLLKKWKSDKQLLVFTGDYIDHGKNSLEVIELVRYLHDKYGAKVIRGNHERNFLKWLDNPEDYWFKKWVEDESIINYHKEAGESQSIFYFTYGGSKTIDSFYGKYYAYRDLPSKHTEYIKNNYAEHILFLRNLDIYFEWKEYVFVHAGVNLEYSNWKETSEKDFCEIRHEFHNLKNETGKIFVFGHHLTRHLNEDKSNDIWISSCKTKIGIDGSAAFNGYLHGLVIKIDDIYSYSADENGIIFKKSIILEN